jgi:cytochrome c oxidase subunit III
MNTKTRYKMKEQNENYRIAPARFNLWLIMIASCMLFAAFVSAYIVHKPDAEAKQLWTQFELPIWFLYSAILSVLSSLTIFLAFRAAKKDELELNKGFLAVTLVLGITFCLSQYMGWKEMLNQGLAFVNAKPEDISASYVWVLTAIHAVHVLGGIILLTVTLVGAFRFKVHKKEMTLMSVAHTYWHFVGILWIYLYLFLYFAR